MRRTTDYGLRTIAAATLVGAGVLAARRFAGLYEFGWSHPSVMLLGQFALLALGTLTRPWALAPFWVFSGATAYALVLRAANDLHGGLAAAAVAAAASALAAALFVGESRKKWSVVIGQWSVSEVGKRDSSDTDH